MTSRHGLDTLKNDVLTVQKMTSQHGLSSQFNKWRLDMVSTVQKMVSRHGLDSSKNGVSRHGLDSSKNDVSTWSRQFKKWRLQSSKNDVSTWSCQFKNWCLDMVSTVQNPASQMPYVLKSRFLTWSRSRHLLKANFYSLIKYISMSIVSTFETPKP